MVADAPPLCYAIVTLCVCFYPCACGYLSTITNVADIVIMVMLCFVVVTNISSNT